MKITPIWLVLFLISSGTCYAKEWFAVSDYERTEFSPSRGESFVIPFELKQQASVEITVTGPDRHPVRVLKSEGELKPGRHQLTWDGRDDQGEVVPDEAWIPVFKAVGKPGDNVVDPWDESGGEVMDDLETRVTEDGAIAYRLSVPARVLIRAGVESGPMLTTIANWVPHAAGRNIQRWDGFDADRLVDLRTQPGLSLLVTAFRLPDHAILTRGNMKTDYVRWSSAKGLQPFRTPREKQLLERKGMAISPHHYLSRALDRDPQVAVELGGNGESSSEGVPLITGKTPIKVDVPPEDRWLLDSSLYEVAFFIDNQFVSEEEQGYLPLTWLWDPSELEPGRHLLTVNVSGFRGQVGVKSLAFETRVDGKTGATGSRK